MKKSLVFLFLVIMLLLLSACQPPVGEATKAQQQKSSKMSSPGSMKTTIQTTNTQTTQKIEKKKAPQPKPKKKRPTFALFGGQKECPRYHQTITAGEKTVCRPPDVCKESELGNAECSANKQFLLTCGVYNDKDGNERFGWLTEPCENKCATVKGESSVCSKCIAKSLCSYADNKRIMIHSACDPKTGKFTKKEVCPPGEYCYGEVMFGEMDETILKHYPEDVKKMRGAIAVCQSPQSSGGSGGGGSGGTGRGAIGGGSMGSRGTSGGGKGPLVG